MTGDFWYLRGSNDHIFTVKLRKYPYLMVLFHTVHPLPIILNYHFKSSTLNIMQYVRYYITTKDKNIEEMDNMNKVT